MADALTSGDLDILRQTVHDTTLPLIPETADRLRAAGQRLLGEVERLTALTHRDTTGFEDLGKQVVTLTAEVERLRGAAHEAEDKVRRVALVRCWTNEDGKRFVFADDLAQALGLPAGGES